jgi:hypothetical protein
MNAKFSNSQVRIGLCCLCLLLLNFPSVCPAAEDYHGLPFHPYRKVADRYYDLRPLYTWLNRPSDQLDPRAQPLKDWIGLPIDRESATTYKVTDVLPEGLLIEESWNAAGTVGEAHVGGDAQFFLINYPDKSRVTDHQRIRFLALRVGTFQYRDPMGGTHTVPKYDYGIPYNPAALAAEHARTNQPAAEHTP